MANYDARFYQFVDRSYAEAAVPVDETGRPIGAVFNIACGTAGANALVSAQGYTAP